jgi:hypothetical protein
MFVDPLPTDADARERKLIVVREIIVVCPFHRPAFNFLLFSTVEALTMA